MDSEGESEPNEWQQSVAWGADFYDRGRFSFGAESVKRLFHLK